MTSEGQTPAVLAEDIRKLADLAAEESRSRGMAGRDIEMLVSCNLALVLSMVLLDDVLFIPGATHPSQERILREVTEFAVAAARRRPAR